MVFKNYNKFLNTITLALQFFLTKEKRKVIQMTSHELIWVDKISLICQKCMEFISFSF